MGTLAAEFFYVLATHPAALRGNAPAARRRQRRNRLTIASRITAHRQGILLNIVVGIVGGFIGGWLLPMIGLSVGGGWLGFLVTAFIGAVILLAIVNLFRR